MSATSLTRVEKIRQNMRKQSFYVWFLGAQEARGVRDERLVRPVLKYLLEREKDVEPSKVTLQVSNKGLKIVQNIVRSGSKVAKKEQLKHLIPPHSLTWVMQAEPPHEDIVCCTLLIYNPVTKCPVHVHAYRCDSVETACTLRLQLAHVMEHTHRTPDPVDSESLSLGFSRPLKGHIQATRFVPAAQKQQPIGSDGRSTRTDEEDPDFEGDVDDEIGKSSVYDGIGGMVNSSASATEVLSSSRPIESTATTLSPAADPGRISLDAVPVAQDPRMVRLYDSLAQELKAKLAGSAGLKCKAQKAPLLLPPKDYDTVCRKQGNLMGIDFRRSTNQSIVGRPKSSDAPIVEENDGNDESDEPLATRREKSSHHPLREHPGHHTSRQSFPPSNNSGKSSSGIGSDEIILDKQGPFQLNAETAADDTSDDEWNFSRPSDRYDPQPAAKLKPRHRSLDFLQQRLDHFHMDERERTTSPPERYRASAPRDSKNQSEEAAVTHFGRLAVPPLRPFSNNSSNHSLLVLPTEAPQCQRTLHAGSGAFSLQSVPVGMKTVGVPTRATSRCHQERPISFPSGVIPVRRDIPSLAQQPAQRFSFHQHPVKESIIEPLINRQPKQRRRPSPGTRNAFDLFVHSSKKPDSADSESAYMPQRLRSPVAAYCPENLTSQSDRPTDYRRQSLAEFRDGAHSGRNPATKYFLNSPLERRDYRSRYSVAESSGQRLY